MISSGATFCEALRSFLIIVAAATTGIAVFTWTTIAVLYFNGNRYQATVMNSPHTDINLCAASFYHARNSFLPSSVIEIGTFTTRIADLGREYSHFIIAVPTHAKPCAFPYKAGTIISVKVVPMIPLAFIETTPILNFHLPIFLSLIGAMTFWVVKILGNFI